MKKATQVGVLIAGIGILVLLGLHHFGYLIRCSGLYLILVVWASLVTFIGMVAVTISLIVPND